MTIAPPESMGARRVLLAPDDASANLELHSLPIGPAGAPALVAIAPNGRLLELSSHTSGERACFVHSDSFIADGRLHFAVPLDPALALLPLLLANASRHSFRFLQPEELLRSDSAPWLARFALPLTPSLQRICSTQEAFGTSLLQLDEQSARTLALRRARHVARTLASHTSVQPLEPSTHIKYAASILREYLPDRFFRFLCIDLDIDSSDDGVPRASSAAESAPADGDDARWSSKQTSQQQQQEQLRSQSKRQQQNAKAAKGTVDISKFFSKKG